MYFALRYLDANAELGTAEQAASYIRSYTHIHTYTHTYMHACMHTYIHTYISWIHKGVTQKTECVRNHKYTNIDNINYKHFTKQYN